jgi:(E)-4-hydroxy-3-methylbut-2-enyl-diphosphate synthase
VQIKRRKTWSVKIGDSFIGSEHPILVQSMCATKTQDLAQTLNQIEMLAKAGAGVVRVAVDSKKDVEALKILAEKTDVPIAVDLQESYRLVEIIAPFVQKVRYNPGHLHHHEKSVSVKDKVKFIVDHAKKNDCAVRIGVNFGSLDPEVSKENIDAKEVALNSVTQHVEIMDSLNFHNFVVSLKSSDPNDVIDINREFAKRFKEIPIHLGVTEAGMLPMGEIKSRVAFENLLVEGIGDTLRVSLTLPYAEKFKEIEIGQKIVDDVNAGRFRSVPRFEQAGLNIISCPSCSRVENEAFVDLASKVKEMTAYAEKENVTIAVMGCRVNGPGETDDADLGLWCAPKHVNFKRKGELIGAFGYDEIIDKLKIELDKIIAENN